MSVKREQDQSMEPVSGWGQDQCWHRGGAHLACAGLTWPQGNASGHRSNGEGYSGAVMKCEECSSNTKPLGVSLCRSTSWW